MESQKCGLLDLPQELKHKIFAKCRLRDILSVGAGCSRLQRATVVYRNLRLLLLSNVAEMLSPGDICRMALVCKAFARSIANNRRTLPMRSCSLEVEYQFTQPRWQFKLKFTSPRDAALPTVMTDTVNSFGLPIQRYVNDRWHRMAVQDNCRVVRLSTAQLHAMSPELMRIRLEKLEIHPEHQEFPIALLELFGDHFRQCNDHQLQLLKFWKCDFQHVPLNTWTEFLEAVASAGRNIAWFQLIECFTPSPQFLLPSARATGILARTKRYDELWPRLWSNATAERDAQDTLAEIINANDSTTTVKHLRLSSDTLGHRNAAYLIAIIEKWYHNDLDAHVADFLIEIDFGDYWPDRCRKFVWQICQHFGSRDQSGFVMYHPQTNAVVYLACECFNDGFIRFNHVNLKLFNLRSCENRESLKPYLAGTVFEKCEVKRIANVEKSLVKLGFGDKTILMAPASVERIAMNKTISNGTGRPGSSSSRKRDRTFTYNLDGISETMKRLRRF